MKLVGLISGGKDSLFSILQSISAGHDVVALANIEPKESNELDSHMYQMVGHEAMPLVAGAIGLPLFRQKISGIAICQNKTYEYTPGDEAEDLYELLSKVKKHVFFEGVSFGVIESDYRRTRIESVCSHLNLKAFAYLWKRDQVELMQEMVDADLKAVAVKVACPGLNPNIHLGMTINDMQNYLLDLNSKYGVSVCGEEEEYETLTLDCPLYHRVISIKETDKVISSDSAFKPIGFLTIKNASLLTKKWETYDPIRSMQARLKIVHSCVKNPHNYVEDIVDEVTQKLYPDKAKPSSSILRLPFETDESSLGESSTNFSQYWKKMYDTRAQPSSSGTQGNDFSKSSLSFTTGWCSIGNVFSSDLGGALECVRRHLERTHYGFHDVVFVNLYVKDLSQIDNINKLYSSFMPKVLPPARVCVETLLPAYTSVLMSVLAHKNISKSLKAIHPKCFPERDAVHVQSVSHWAPASIGPYSQCVKVGGIYYVAGQIPLVPGSMEIFNKPIFHQCRLALRHVKRILQAMNKNLTYSNVLQAICYVTSGQIAIDIYSLWTYITAVNHSVVTAIVVPALPRNAQLEWEVMACNFERPLVSEDECSVEEFSVYMKRCVFSNPFASGLVCKIKPLRKGAKKVPKTLTPKILDVIINNCVSFMRTSSSYLCTLKLFYKISHVSPSCVVNEVIHSLGDSKVIATAIPVIGFEDSDAYIVISGVCH